MINQVWFRLKDGVMMINVTQEVTLILVTKTCKQK